MLYLDDSNGEDVATDVWNDSAKAVESDSNRKGGNGRNLVYPNVITAELDLENVDLGGEDTQGHIPLLRSLLIFFGAKSMQES